MPQVNRDLAVKLMSQPTKKYGSLVEDDRFKQMFENPDFEIDKAADEFRLLNPVISKMDKKKTKKMEAMFAAVDEDGEIEGKGSSDEDDSSSDDDREWVKEVQEERKKLRNEQRIRQREEDNMAKLQPKFYEFKGGEDFKVSDLNSNEKRKSTKYVIFKISLSLNCPLIKAAKIKLIYFTKFSGQVWESGWFTIMIILVLQKVHLETEK